MKILYLDCTNGVSGDMFMSAMIDAGIEEGELVRQLGLLELEGYNIKCFSSRSYGVTGRSLDINIYKKQPERSYKEVRDLIHNSKLDNDVKKTALIMLESLARAKSKVHGVSLDEVCFHEPGAIDTVLDLTGAAIALHLLKPDKIFSTPLSLGKGFVKYRNGLLPVPAPVTAELIKGLPARFGPVEGELVTPTGAAIVKTLAGDFTEPDICFEHTGYGIGTRDHGIPNYFRVFTGLMQKTKIQEEILILECNIDDMNNEILPHVQEKLLKAGALDVYMQNIIMKKGRPGVQFKVLCTRENFYMLEEIIFKETSTFGIRYRKEKRLILNREFKTVSTPYGDINVKTGYIPGEDSPLHYSPEYEDCRKAAAAHNVPLKEVYNSTVSEFRRLFL